MDTNTQVCTQVNNFANPEHVIPTIRHGLQYLAHANPCGQLQNRAHFIENSEYLQFGGCVKHIRDIPPGAHIVSHTKGLRDGVEVDFITYYMLAEIGLVEVWYWNTAGNQWYPSVLELRDITNAGYPNQFGGTVLFYALPEGC